MSSSSKQGEQSPYPKKGKQQQPQGDRETTNRDQEWIGIIDADYEKFPLSENKPYSVETEDISEDESPEKEIEKEIKVHLITGRFTMISVRKMRMAAKRE